MFKQIITGPHITEKSMVSAPEKRYVFKVAKEANKAEIAKGVKDIYKVKVLSVKTINIQGKQIKYRQRYGGQRKSWKKAVVAIDPKQTIKDFVVKE